MTFRIMSALLDQTKTVIQLQLCVAWRASPFLLSANSKPRPLKRKSPIPEPTRDSGLPEEGPATARLLQQRAPLRGNLKVLGRPLLTKIYFPGLPAMPGIPLG